MGRTIVDISPSLDGYVAGPGVTVEAPFGTALFGPGFTGTLEPVSALAGPNAFHLSYRVGR
ncbi:hypothetical protein [Thermoactinospora rubra]|uniref:hypothetical protein n=1 Tax=Thermoactinospora rubra TaxID=1088767 RepID=UPI000A116CC8|nr:hypothetical protein [Thermoactinospora rubra]